MATYAETWISLDPSGPAYFEILDFVLKKDGLLIPKPAVTWIPWIKEAGELVLELAEAGRVIGHPTKFLGEGLTASIAEQTTELLEHRTAPARSKLIAFGERFVKGKLSAERYLYVNSRMQLHLAVAMGQPVKLVFVAVANTFELWTIEFYSSVRLKLAALIPECCATLDV
jgi:hypothetical protein